MVRRARHHHFVPKVLLRQFSENRKNLWLSVTGVHGEYLPPEWRNIDSVFKELDFYTVLDSRGNPTDIVEKRFFSTIDDVLGKLLTEIDEIFNKGKVPVFEGEQLTSLHHMMLNMSGRTPHGISEGYLDDLKIGQEYAEKVISHLEIREPGSPKISKIKNMMFDRKALTAEGRNIRVRGQIAEKPLAIEAMQKFKVRWAISEGKHSFVLPSSVVYRIGNGGSNGLANPDCEWWMPIGPKRAIVLLQDPMKKIPMVYKISRDHMREVNESSASSRRGLVSSSRELLLSLTNCARK